MESKIQVVEKNEGAKIAYEQSGTRIFFGDEDLMLNVSKYQRDYPLQVDICKDGYGNLVIGPGLWYVAQIDIPAIKYEPVEEPVEMGGDTPAPKPLPIDMSEVVLTLWALN